MSNVIKSGADTQQDQVVQATNMLGLNTVANPSTLPYGATPRTLNTDYHPGGSVSSRPGTGRLGTISTSRTEEGPIHTHEYKTVLGYNYIISAYGDRLDIQEVLWSGKYDDLGNDGLGYRTKAGVFNVEPTNVNFTNLGNGRVLILTGTNTPVELRFNEYTYTVPDGGQTDPTLVLSGVPGWHHAQGPITASSQTDVLAHDCFVYVDGVEVMSPTKTSTNISSLTVHGTYPAGTKIDIVRAIWGWWSESRVWYGDRLFGTAPRFRVSDNSRTVSIPTPLRDGLKHYYNSNTGTQLDVGYGTVLTVPSRHGTFTYGNTADANHYWLSSGTTQQARDFTENAIGSVLGSAITSVTFATLHTAGTLDENTGNNTVLTTFSRVRDMEFTAGSRLAGQTSGAFVLHDEVLVRKRWGDSSDVRMFMDVEGLNGTDTYSGYALEYPGFDPVIRRPTPANHNAIGFHQYPSGTNSSTTIRRGVQPDAQVMVVNLVNNHVGIGANKDRLQTNTDGFVIPAFGVSDFCDQGLGVFPNCGAVFNSRLFLGGVASDPLRVFASAPSDVYVAGEQYQYFQADIENDPDTAPTDFVLQNVAQSNFIAKMKTAYGSLFCFGRDGVWRVLPSLHTQMCCDFGLSNLRACTMGDGRLFFSSNDGVFELVQSEGLSDSYVPSEITTPIRNVFDWFTVQDMGFDQDNNRLFCYDDNNTIFVYYTETGGWSQWQFGLPHYFTLRGTTQFHTKDNESEFCYWFSAKPLGSLVKYYAMSQLDFPAVLDYIGSDEFESHDWATDAQWGGPYGPTELMPSKTTSASEDYVFLEQRVPAIPLLSEAQHDLYTGGDNTTIGTLQTFAVDSEVEGNWFYPGLSIVRFNQLTTPATTYRLLPKFPSQVYGSFYEYAVTSTDNFEFDYTWTRVGLVDANTVTWSPVSTLDEEQRGWAYPSFWQSGKFNMGQLTQYKRVNNISISYDNEFINPTKTEYCFTSSGVNPWVYGESTARQLVNGHVVTNFEDGYSALPWEDVYNSELTFQGDVHHRFSGQSVTRLPVQGIGYDFQFTLFNYAPEAWHMTAFQLDGRMKGKRYAGK